MLLVKKSSYEGIMLNHKLKTVGNRGVSENSLFFTKKTLIRYNCFNVKIRFNNFISEQNPNRFSEIQYFRYRLIKTPHDNDLGY